MPDPMLLDAAFPVTTTRLVERFTATRPRLVALRDVARSMAQRHGSESVPAAISADAGRLLAVVRSIVARQRGTRALLVLGDVPDWATLLARLELALVALATFQEEHSAFDDELGAVVWHDETWRDLHVHEGELMSGDSGLHESYGKVIHPPPGRAYTPLVVAIHPAC